MNKLIVSFLIMSTLSGCASWCDNATDHLKCQEHVRIVRDVVIITAVLATAGAAAYAIKKNNDGGNYYNKQTDVRPYQGNCYYRWQIASDGSQCGERSAEAREGQ